MTQKNLQSDTTNGVNINLNNSPFKVGDWVRRKDSYGKNSHRQKGYTFKVRNIGVYGLMDSNGYYHAPTNVELIEPVTPQSNLEFLASFFADLIKAQIEKPNTENAKRINLVIASIQKELGGENA